MKLRSDVSRILESVRAIILVVIVAFQYDIGLCEFVRSVVFNVKVNEEPLNLGIDIWLAKPWGSYPEMEIPCHITYGFRILSDGKFITSNTINSGLDIWDLATHHCHNFKPAFNGYDKLVDFIVGPENEIFTELRKHFPGSDSAMAVKYIPQNNEYIIDSTFTPVTLEHVNLASISVKRELYLSEITYSSYGEFSYRVYGTKGELLGQGDAIGELPDGMKFFFRTEPTDKAGVFNYKGADAVTGKIFFEVEVNDTTGSYFYWGYTLNNKIILLKTRTSVGGETHHFEDGKWMSCFTPEIVIINPETGAQEKILTTDCKRDDFTYYNISSVQSDYNGNIYALAVYFNTPGELIGDERIVLYKWVPK
jgi:hypothetical protein